MKELIRKILSEERKPKGYWDDDINIEKEAIKYQRLSDFSKQSQYAYNAAKNKGKEFFNRVTAHMVRPKSLSPYTDDELADIASNYLHKKDFIKNDNGAYQVALSRGDEFYKRITSHMVPLGSKRKRMVYGYFFPNNNAVYVGLTYNIDERNKQHLITDVDNKKQTTVAKFINVTKERPELVKFTNYIDVQEAQNKEGEYVDKFKNLGYLILNKVKTGSVGPGLKYTDNELKDLLSTIVNYKDLYKKHYPLYKSAKNRGLDFLYDVTKHMERNQIKWSEELVRQYAKDFTSKNEFQKVFGGAANYAKSHKFWDDLFPKQIPSEDEIINTAVQYNTQNDFRIAHPTLYYYADILNLLPKIMFKKSKKRGPSLTPDDIIRISQNFTTLKDFYKNENSAYRRGKEFCKKLGNDFCVKVFGHFN